MSRTPRSGAVLALVVMLLLVACSRGPGPGGVVAWRELTIDLPGEWVEVNRTGTSLTVANAQGAEEAGERGEQEVLTQFTIEPDTTPDDHRQFVEERGGELELDTRATVGGLPARMLQFTWTTDSGIPLRERVLLVASRDLVIFQQPTPMAGETGGPDWFDEHVEEFDALVENVKFGAPEGFLEDE